jgi:hypothetical protein
MEDMDLFFTCYLLVFTTTTLFVTCNNQVRNNICIVAHLGGPKMAHVESIKHKENDFWQGIKFIFYVLMDIYGHYVFMDLEKECHTLSP